jgi:preprotein translocase subunit SecB
MKRKNTQVSRYADSGYEQFLKSVRPIALGLLESSCKVDRFAYGRIMSQKNRPGKLISTEYKLREAESGYFDATGRFSLAVAEGQKANPALVIEAVYESHFHCKSPVDKELAERFVSSDLRLIMWPYFRELIFDLCGKMSIPPITIPLATSAE